VVRGSRARNELLARAAPAQEALPLAVGAATRGSAWRERTLRRHRITLALRAAQNGRRPRPSRLQHLVEPHLERAPGALVVADHGESDAAAVIAYHQVAAPRAGGHFDEHVSRVVEPAHQKQFLCGATPGVCDFGEHRE
jgi:hypothetical protein